MTEVVPVSVASRSGLTPFGLLSESPGRLMRGGHHEA